MHMAWMRSVCGRLKSDYRYSTGIVYNNFPWPQHPTDTNSGRPLRPRPRACWRPGRTTPMPPWPHLYDPLTMPPDLVQAHRKLDAAVDAAYGKRKFSGDRDRVAFLFELYQQIISPLSAKKNLRRK